MLHEVQGNQTPPPCLYAGGAAIPTRPQNKTWTKHEQNKPWTEQNGNKP